MGQRHQAFLIAKIVPQGETDAKYRCIAAMHHQWCYGSLPLRATRRLLTLLKKPEHGQIILEELRALDGQYGRWRVPPKTPPVPCPFSSYLMFSAFNIDLSDNIKEPYLSNNWGPLDANMGSSDGDNNDGITVIDITDPKNPAYCFVSLSEMTPLTATDYVRSYYPPPKPGKSDDHANDLEQMVLGVISALEGERLVTPQMLVEAWPREYKGSLGKQINGQSNQPGFGSVKTDSPVPLLSDLALNPAIQYALGTGDTKDIEQLLWLPGKTEAVIRILKSYKPFPDSGISLLIGAFNQLDGKSVDISSFSLSTPQILSFLVNVPSVQILDLSHNPLVTGDTIRAILEAIPTLKRLILLDTSVTDEALCSLFRDHQKLFFNLEALTHPLLLNGKTSRFPNAFAIITIDSFTTAASLPFFTLSFIIQALSDYLRAAIDVDYSSSLTGSIAPHVALSSTIRKNTEMWGDRTVPMVASFSRDGAINGEGWIFGLDSYGWYGFIKTKPNEEPDPVERVLDLKEFMSEMESEGRPSAPASAVDKLCTILDQLKVPGGRFVFKLMDMSAANAFVELNRKKFANYM